MEMKPILSVGVDIGTTSTHLTVSRLHLAKASRLNEPGKVIIERREIVYQSPVYFTPLKQARRYAKMISGQGGQYSQRLPLKNLAALRTQAIGGKNCSPEHPLSSFGHKCIDALGVLSLLNAEYTRAGVTPENIDTGAVIVTGETARMRNAAEVAAMLSGLAGKFVVASAGPNLESILAARGSGAALDSQRLHSTICNIDIGGGTTNIAIFKHGLLMGTTAIAVGGRFVRLSNSLKVLNVTGSGKLISREVLGQPLTVGTTIDGRTAKKLARHAAEAIISLLLEPSVRQPLLITAPAAYEGVIDEYWFSGGIAEIMKRLDCGALGDTEYGDIGVFLGRALVELIKEKQISYCLPEQPIRATVIGAGIHSLQLSGSTVAVVKDLLPIVNLPVIRPFAGKAIPGSGADDNEIATSLEACLSQALSSHDLDWTARPIAIFLPELGRMGYSGLSRWANALVKSFHSLRGHEPLVVVCAHDIAAALGQLIRALLSNIDCIVLDGISDTTCGDFIDIGRPLADNQYVPVVMKDLLFGQP